ncbi:carboxylic acid reductase [Nocardia sp. NBC_01503]|uniref:carboxylic acid reductase n=1 Tax=Nocardia sp. NBC_01503 TaxID=2975997 RepID=UPI002E7B9DC1|nr:carboxylic acid reductase [Nocardia sp. NBC_01503]WTL29443.1 carboxylic acid reductase [Nocardia sp. NBC_01503]
MGSGTSEAARRQRIGELLADAQVHAALQLGEVNEAIRREGLGPAEIVSTVLMRYSERPALGERAYEVVTDRAGRRTRRLLERFETITYGELGERVGAVRAAWAHGAGTARVDAARGSDTEPVDGVGDSGDPVRVGDFVATLGFTSADYTTVELVCQLSGLVSVPLQASGSVAQWNSILGETAPRVLVTSAELLAPVLEAIPADMTPVVMVIDFHADDDYHSAAVESARERLARDGRPIVVETLTEVLARGRVLPPVEPVVVDADALALLIYTSGSTGAPKGAIYPARLVSAMWTGGAAQSPIPAINFSYMPMSHVAGRLSLLGALSRGGTAYFAAASDLSTLFEDIALVRPTEFFFVPRVCDMLFQRFLGEVGARVAAGIDRDDAMLEVKTELRERVMGGRLFGAIVGSAPVSAEMKTFMESLLELELHDGYGSTEAGGAVLMDNRLNRPPVIDYRLADVPELGYFATDKPYPRGELLLKTTVMIPGYFKRPEITAEIFDADGFYRTGDIVAELGPDELVYVDRRNNVLKLSQGEFVTVAKLEAVYATSPLIRQIYIYGNSERAYLLAVIVPTADALPAGLDAAASPALREALTESLQRLAKQDELESYEIPRAFLIETEPFSVENGLLAGLGKLLRPKFKERYGERLEALYGELAAAQAQELANLRQAAEHAPVLETVGRAAGALLGCAPGDLRPDAHFADLGGDSLSALSFSTLLGEILGIEVPVSVIVSPANDLAAVARYIELERDSSERRPTVGSVHGPGPLVRAADLTLDEFIDSATLAAAPELPGIVEQPRTVLLTGANGYLGRFLCLEWLRRVDISDGTVICIVRGGTVESARARLDAAFDSGDAELLREYRELAARRLVVLPGDIAEPNFVLPEADWLRLAETVDLIVHPAALVNHVLPYGQLFGPNVVGTAEIIRLALTSRLKPVTYLSTVAVADQVDPELFDEDGDIRLISAERTIGDGYANGYGTSKWAGEVLLREAHDLCGLPVAVFRSDMILAHSRYAGQFNLTDMFSRLLLSLLATGIAPKSFYRTDSHGNRLRAHYDGLPADFTAEAITVLGAQTTGFQTFDVFNPHDDGISLDSFVDWLIEDGHHIDRLDDYGTWFSRFETALRALPEQQRQASVLPLLHAYRHPAMPIPGSALPAKRFQAAVQAAEIGPDHDIPHLNSRLIGKYVTDLRLRGLYGPGRL